MPGKRRKSWAVAVARLLNSKKQFQALLKLAEQSDMWDRLDDDRLRALVIIQCLRFGSDGGEDLVELAPSIARLYAHFVERFPAEARAETYIAVVDAVENGDSNFQALMPFLLFDPNLDVSSTSAMDMAVYHPLENDDLLSGPRFLMEMARCPDAKQGLRIAILTSFLRLGDRRLLPMLHGSWELLGDEGRQTLAGVGSEFPTAGQIEFFVDWLECTDDENLFAAIAGTLAGLPGTSLDGWVHDIEREFPLDPTNKDHAVRFQSSWTFEEYGQILKPRLERLADAESEPKVIPLLLASWIEPSRE